MESVSLFSSVIGDPNLLFFTISVGLGGLAMATGRVPRAGPGRAFVIAVSSFLRPARRPFSWNTESLARLNNHLAVRDWGSEYIVVIGPKGVGKTCLINTALNNRAGIIRVEASSGQTVPEIRENVMRAVTNLSNRIQNAEPSFRRVVWWYPFFACGNRPVVVLNLAERSHAEEYAHVTGAVRVLAEEFKLRVIVDASPNAIEAALLKTNRCIEVNVDPMPETVIQSVPEFTEVQRWLQEANLLETVMELFNGYPVYWNKLVNAGNVGGWAALDPDRRKQELESTIFTMYKKEVSELERFAHDDKDLLSVADLFFKNNNKLPFVGLGTHGLRRPRPDKTFRLVEDESTGGLLLEPANPMLYYILKYGRGKYLTMENLKHLTALEYSARRRHT
jgi:hypothetical protein